MRINFRRFLWAPLSLLLLGSPLLALAGQPVSGKAGITDGSIVQVNDRRDRGRWRYRDRDWGKRYDRWDRRDRRDRRDYRGRNYYYYRPYGYRYYNNPYYGNPYYYNYNSPYYYNYGYPYRYYNNGLGGFIGGILRLF